MKQNKMTEELVVLLFTREDQQAAIVTNGSKFITYQPDHHQEHGSLFQAIAWLEVRGWNIITDYFK